MPLSQTNTNSANHQLKCFSSHSYHTMATKENYTASSTTSTPSWLLDSGASHHVTSDLTNLSMHTPYNGSDDIMIGDGSGLPITHICSTYLATSKNNFHLNNVLCVPGMKKNLIWISQFCNKTKFQLSSYRLLFMWRNFVRGQYFWRAKLKMVSMSGQHSLRLLHFPTRKPLHLSGIID